jgi:hypothetical protein
MIEFYNTVKETKKVPKSDFYLIFSGLLNDMIDEREP